MIGILKTDVTRLHKLFVLEPMGAQRPRNKDMYWSFHYQLVLTIDGLNMKCEFFLQVHYPAFTLPSAPSYTTLQILTTDE